jgi:hypothetical protein
MLRYRTLWIIILLIITTCLCPNLSFSASEQRLALLVGNSNYTHGGSLPNPVNDIRAMKKALEALGFTVMKYENCTQREMKMAMDNFGSRLKGKDVGLFFYAGHGVQVSRYNYLIPVDAKLRNEKKVEYNCVRADRILSEMESAGSRTNIVILDACRNNPFERSWSRGPKGAGLAFMNAPSGSLIAYSTAPGKTALDGEGKNSPYTSALLQHIGTPNITVIEMFQWVRSTVMARSKSKQVPWESTSLRGNFYFSTKGKNNRFNEDQSGSKIEVASVPKNSSYPQPSSTSNVIERDGVYVAYDNGIVKDMRTGLEWKSGPDKDTDWKKARSWVKSLTLDGGGWRMPTLKELRGLYKKGEGDRNMTSLLKTTGWYIWAGSAGGSPKARGFIFYTGYSLRRHRSIISNDWRAFAVRFRSEG